MNDPNQKNISDPSYNAADLRAQLAAGRLRWFATILAVPSAGLFIYLLTLGDKAELDFPFNIQGRAALWAVGIIFVFWTVIAIANWKSWLKRKNDAP